MSVLPLLLYRLVKVPPLLLMLLLLPSAMLSRLCKQQATSAQAPLAVL